MTTLLLGILIFLLLPSSSRAWTTQFTPLERDALCACRQFRTNVTSAWSLARRDEEGRDEFCESVGFFERYLALIPGRYELGVGAGGLRALVFVSKTTPTTIFAFRHFEHDKMDYYVDDDAWQLFGMFGGEGSEWWVGYFGEEWTGRARWVCYYLRLVLGFDYVQHASNMVDEVLGHGKPKTPYFTGFGPGGTVAALQAMRVQGSFGATFSAHRPGENAKIRGFDVSTKRVTNFLLSSDVLLGGHEPATRECTFAEPDLYRMLNRAPFSVYADEGFPAVVGPKSCVDPW